MKTTKIVLLALSVVLLAGCGSKKNKVNPYGGIGYSSLSAGLSSQQAAEINNLQAAYPCSNYSNSGQRIADVTFSSNQTIGGNGALPPGELQIGGSVSGNITGVYAGISAYRDIMVVKTFSDGRFTVSLSFCTYPYYIVPGATVTNFLLQSGTIGSQTSCSVGRVIANNTIARITGGQYGQNDVPTSFTPVSCQNGSYNSNYNNSYNPYGW